MSSVLVWPPDKADNAGAGLAGSIAAAGGGTGSGVVTLWGDGEGVGDEETTSICVDGAEGLQPETPSKTRADASSVEVRESTTRAVKATLGDYWILAMWVSVSALRPGFNSPALV